MNHFLSNNYKKKINYILIVNESLYFESVVKNPLTINKTFNELIFYLI
jgi:hypothetical protein